MKTRIIRGQENPVVQGWLPRGHGIRGVRPIPTVVYERHTAKPITFLTINIVNYSESTGIEIKELKIILHLFCCEVLRVFHEKWRDFGLINVLNALSESVIKSGMFGSVRGIT